MGLPDRLGAVLTLLLVLPWGAARAVEGEASYQFLAKQAGLQAEYGRLGQATESMQAACATPEGGADAGCWRKLAAVAERAGRIGVAIDAWQHAGALGDGQAAGEAGRLEGTYGRVVWVVPGDRGLPTLAAALQFEGLLIDPNVKAYVRSLQEQVAAEGLHHPDLWLPAGRYTLEGVSWAVVAGEDVDVVLPRRLVPWRHQAFGLGDRVAAGVAGPLEFGGDLRISFGGAPEGGMGWGPVAVGGQVRLGVHVGPLRLEARGRVEGWPVASTSHPGSERDTTGLVALGQVDVGVDLMLAPRAFLTPHAGVVGGSLGSAIVACLAEAEGGPTVLEGECRLGVLGVGGQAGVDLWFLPPAPGGRLGLRVGFVAEAGAGGTQAAPQDLLEGGSGLTLLRMDNPTFVWLRGGVDVGVSLRF